MLAIVGVTSPFGAAPTRFQDSIPNIVALVKLGEEPVKIGVPVEMVTRRIRQDGDERGMLIYGYTSVRLRRKFRPVLVGPR